MKTDEKIGGEVMLHVAAAIIRRNGKILICRRGAGGNCAYLWEFPGGKVDSGETPEECVTRECREELDIEIRLKEIYEETTFSYPDKDIAFSFYNAELLKGQPVKKVHTDIVWALPEELLNYEFCPADVDIVKKLAVCNV